MCNSGNTAASAATLEECAWAKENPTNPWPHTVLYDSLENPQLRSSHIVFVFSLWPQCGTTLKCRKIEIQQTIWSKWLNNIYICLRVTKWLVLIEYMFVPRNNRNDMSIVRLSPTTQKSQKSSRLEQIDDFAVNFLIVADQLLEQLKRRRKNI